jgi:hypothetical protein
VFSVVMSTTRKRRRVIGSGVVFLNRRWIESVPKALGTPGSMRPLRTRLGGAVEAAVGSMSDALTTALRWTGLAGLFSGPGAPRIDWTPP